MGHGGRRPGAGRKPGGISLVRRDVAAAILERIDVTEIWTGLLRDENPRIRLEAARYLTDRAHGRPREAASQPATFEGGASGKVNPEQEKETDLALIKTSLRAVVQSGGEAARVAAANALLRLYGTADGQTDDSAAELLRQFAETVERGYENPGDAQTQQ